MLAGLLRIAGTKVQRSELVQRPCLTGLVADFLRGGERTAERPNEIDPAKGQHAEAVQRLRDADLLLVPLFAIETVEQAEERPDLIRQEARVEEPILGHGLEQLVGVLDPIGDRVGGVLQFLDRLDQCRRLPACILFRERRAQGCRVLARLRLVGLRWTRTRTARTTRCRH